MKKFSDTFTQGGQTALHNLHMMRQVFSSTIKISLFFSIFLFLFFIFKKNTWQDYYFLGAYLKSICRTKLAFLPRGFFDTTWVVFDKTRWVEISDYNLSSKIEAILFSNHMIAHLIKSTCQTLCVFMMSITAISFFWIWRGKKHQETKIVKGYELVDPQILKKQIKKIGFSNIKISDIPLPLDAECEHLMITGTTGTGKTNAINDLLTQIRCLGHKAVIIDSSGGFVDRFFDSSKDKLLNPFDQRTEHWNLWKECKEDYDFDEFSESLVPPEKYDTFWTKAAQQLFSAAALTIKDNNPSIKKLLHFLLSKPLDEIVEILKDTYVSSYVDPSAEKTAMGIRATLTSSIKNLKYLDTDNPIEDAHSFSIREWLESEAESWLFLSSLSTQREVLKPLMSAWLSIAVKSLMSMGEHRTRRVWFIIDELASLNRVPILMQGLAEIRKYGGCFVLGFQDLNQLDIIYGQQTARTLGALTGTKVIFRLDSHAAKQMSELFADQEILESNESISFGAHQMRDGVSLTAQQKTRSLISPADLMKLDNFEAYLKFPRNLPATKIKFKRLEINPLTSAASL